jgi:hypothetical protein
LPDKLRKLGIGRWGISFPRRRIVRWLNGKHKHGAGYRYPTTATRCSHTHQYTTSASHPDQNSDADSDKNTNADGNSDPLANDGALADHDSKEKSETCAGERRTGKTARVF